MKTQLNRAETAELYNLYHLARTALASAPRDRQSPYDRKLWATAEFVKAHPGVHSHTSVYLTFERADAGLV